jgi:hypothetical protein
MDNPHNNNNIDDIDDIETNNLNDIYQDIINKYIEYYKKTYTDKNVKNMFENINYDDQTSTNHIMEIFYTEILKYNKLDNKIYTNSDDFDKDKYTELYGLQINGNIKCVSVCILSLIIEIINNQNDNDYKNWNIIHLK